MRTPAHEKTYNALHAATKRAEEAERQRDEARAELEVERRHAVCCMCNKAHCGETP